jgi:hypothetical protein
MNLFPFTTETQRAQSQISLCANREIPIGTKG